MADLIEGGLQAFAVGQQLRERQREEGLDAGAEEAIGGGEGGVDFGVGAGGVGRVVDAPVAAEDRAEVGRAGFAGGVRADGEDEIGGDREVIPGLAVVAGGGDAFPGEEGEGARMDLAGGFAACTHGPPAGGCEVVEGGFGEDGAAGVAGA